MTSLNDYLALIPSANATKPNFVASLSAALTNFVNLLNVSQTLYSYFDLDTAVGVQLDQVGQWIGRDRYVTMPISGVFFSWNITGVGWQQGYWKGQFAPSEGVIALDDDTYRAVLRAKIASNNWDGTVETAKAAYEALVHPAIVKIKDNQDMSFSIAFTKNVPTILRALITNGEIPLKPEGVSVSYTFS